MEKTNAPTASSASNGSRGGIAKQNRCYESQLPEPPSPSEPRSDIYQREAATPATRGNVGGGQNAQTVRHPAAGPSGARETSEQTYERLRHHHSCRQEIRRRTRATAVLQRGLHVVGHADKRTQMLHKCKATDPPTNHRRVGREWHRRGNTDGNRRPQGPPLPNKCTPPTPTGTDGTDSFGRLRCPVSVNVYSDNSPYSPKFHWVASTVGICLAAAMVQ